jgi:hypothetical protein
MNSGGKVHRYKGNILIQIVPPQLNSSVDENSKICKISSIIVNIIMDPQENQEATRKNKFQTVAL